MGMGTRGIRMVSSFAALCVLAAAGAVRADDRAESSPPSIDISGRWEGRTFELSRKSSDCGGKPCTLTLDIGRCATGWCGVEVVGQEKRCGTTALKIEAATSPEGYTGLFKGKLELAEGTEPYVVEVSLITLAGDEKLPHLQIVGDTGGEFRMFRRSFPFSTTLSRAGDAVCKVEKATS